MTSLAAWKHSRQNLMYSFYWGLVDLVRFELMTSSMPFRNINHLQTVWRKTKDLERGHVDAGGRHWEATSEMARIMLSRARLQAVVITVSLSRQLMISL